VIGLTVRVWLLTGAPGVGKTTVLSKTVDILKGRGVSVGGMVSREARDCCTRLGFEVIDIANGKKGWLAHVDQKKGPQVGKYRVNLADLEAIGVEAITQATANCEVVAIDEIGPMELFSQKFKAAVAYALESAKPVLAVVHAKAHDPLIAAAKGRADAEVLVVTADNRDGLPMQLAQQLLKAR
jgi:nucleoside-triphosphatase